MAINSVSLETMASISLERLAVGPLNYLTYPAPFGPFDDEFPFPKVGYVCSLEGTIPKFKSSPLKNDSWKMILSSWGPITFQGRTVKHSGEVPVFWEINLMQMVLVILRDFP